MSADKPQMPNASPTAGMYGPPADLAEERRYFPVSARKFVVMSLFTLTFYQLYWFYKNWQRIRDRSGENISPFWRAFFSPIWGFNLLKRISDDAQSRKFEVAWSHQTLALAYLVLQVLTVKLPDPWWLIAFAAFIPLIPAVRTIAAMNAAEPAREDLNERFTAGNIAGMIVGGFFLLLVVIGSFLPEP